MEVSKGVTGTLRAQQHSHQPAVLQSAGFCTEHSAKAKINREKPNPSKGTGADTQGTGAKRSMRVIPTLLSRDYKGIANHDLPRCEKLVIPEVDYEKDV